MAAPVKIMDLVGSAEVDVTYSSLHEIMHGTGRVYVDFHCEGPHPEVTRGYVTFEGRRGDMLMDHTAKKPAFVPSENGQFLEVTDVGYRNEKTGAHHTVSVERIIVPLMDRKINENGQIKDGKVIDFSDETVNRKLRSAVEESWQKAAQRAARKPEEKLRLDQPSDFQRIKPKTISLHLPNLNQLQSMIGKPAQVGNESKTPMGPGAGGAKSIV